MSSTTEAGEPSSHSSAVFETIARPSQDNDIRDERSSPSQIIGLDVQKMQKITNSRTDSLVPEKAPQTSASEAAEAKAHAAQAQSIFGSGLSGGGFGSILGSQSKLRSFAKPESDLKPISGPGISFQQLENKSQGSEESNFGHENLIQEESVTQTLSSPLALSKQELKEGRIARSIWSING